MGFLSGPLTFQCFHFDGSALDPFGTEHLKKLKRFAIGQVDTASADQADVGFLAGNHILDTDFTLEKNVIGEALHCAVRIDTHQIPSAVRKAWLQIELANLGADNPSGRPTKVQRREAKESVEVRCEEEIQSGKFRRMQQFPVLWDARQSILYCGGSSTGAADHCTDLWSRAFELELTRLSAGRRALHWATEAKRLKALDDTMPSAFRPGDARTEIAWWDQELGNFDFLGNEFLLWLWWRWETESDTIALPDDSEVTGMFARTLSLQCPRGESGKETISAEAPTQLPEAAQAIRSGKLPRKAGLTLVRQGEQYELVLQAETFCISGAKIQTGDAEAGGANLEDRVESLRNLHDTVNQLFHVFCDRRIGKNWSGDLEGIHRWLKSDGAKSRRTT